MKKKNIQYEMKTSMLTRDSTNQSTRYLTPIRTTDRFDKARRSFLPAERGTKRKEQGQMQYKLSTGTKTELLAFLIGKFIYFFFIPDNKR